MKMNKQEAKNLTINLFHQGFSVSYIAESVKKSKSTVYKYIQEYRDEKVFPKLEKEIKKTLLSGDFTAYIHSLSYIEICMITRHFKLAGYDKNSKIKSILKYFKDYSILGLYPENLNKAGVKKAFYRRAKKVHPDFNKSMDKKGEEFQEVYQSYTTLMEAC